MSDKTNDSEPVHLVEDDETGDRFLVYGTDKGMRLDIRYEGETLWMSQGQMAELFGVTVPSISRHIANILEDGELNAEATVTQIETVRSEGARRVTRSIDNFNLDMVISVGYRVSSTQATVFRRWATGVLVQFAKTGFVVDTARLKQPENADRIAELREIIRDIRSDEANLYAELKRICSLCQDYDGSSETAREFFQYTQAKLVYAVTTHTPAEIVARRADSAAQNMGLHTWPKDNIQKRDVSVSKNYLAQGEIRELNRLTTILLDIFEDQLDIGRLLVMQDAKNLLDGQLAQLGRSVLNSGGSIRNDAARQMAESQYDAFNKLRKLEQQREADTAISLLAAEAKKLPKPPRR